MKRANLLGLALLGATLFACTSTMQPTGAHAAAEPAPPGGGGATAPLPSGVLFDDFQYDGPTDPRIGARGWTVRTESGAPGRGTTWSADAVSFPDDASAQGGRAMQLRATSDGTAEGTVKAQVHTDRYKFYSGTYAARVYFNDTATLGTGDHPVQAFYTISPENRHYSELDHEYLPNGGWGTNGPTLYNTAWNHYDEKVAGAKTLNEAIKSLQGWHTLALTFTNGVANFYVDGEWQFRPAMDYSPRHAMSISFNQWFINKVGEPLVKGPKRTWDMKVNWVYYNNAGAQTPTQIKAAVDNFYANGTHFVDTVPERPVIHDYNGDRISDVSLFYDYGTDRPCGGKGTRNTAMFTVPGSADRSGKLGGLADQWRSPCQLVSPKFTTSGDFNEDGKSDVAAFYDYGGSENRTCTGKKHVAILVWHADPDRTGKLRDPVTAWDDGCFGNGTSFMDSGDFNGDGISDIALLYHHGAGHMQLYTLSGHTNGGGQFHAPMTRWNQKDWGADVEFLTTGDYNGDNKDDVGLFYNYGNAGATCAGNSHQAIFVLTANSQGSGAMSTPMKPWESHCFGDGTAFVDSGDFNGDGKSDIALLYDYGSGHMRLFTLTAQRGGGLSGLVSRWDQTTWGTKTKYFTTGDYNGDRKDDIALFSDFGNIGASCPGNTHQAIHTLTANRHGSGTFTDDPNGTDTSIRPAKAWSSDCFGNGTTSMN